MAERKRRLNLRPRQAQPVAAAAEAWPILVVDDDPQVHDMTRVLLRDFRFDGRAMQMLSATSAAEAKALFESRPDIPVVLLDVVMETPDAGLRLVRHIRDELGDRRVRIILRTGQPGEAPERDVVLAYDINDYKSKAELTAQRLFTAIVGSLRAWRDIVTIERLNAQLGEFNASLERRVAERTCELERSRSDLAAAKERAELALARETEAKRQQRQFLSMVSHEFRTPLAIIDSASQMLLMASGRDDGARRRIDAIRGGVQRLLGLIDTSLVDEQLDRGSLAANSQAIDVAALLSAAVANSQNAQPGRAFRYQGPKAAAGWGDPGLLSIAFGNLIGNAVKYSTEEQPVDITLEQTGGTTRVVVEDHGIGIPPGDLPRVFERFHRAANARGVSGSGIGLHLVKQIVELHHGRVEVASEVGEGSRFTLTLPGRAEIGSEVPSFNGTVP